MTQPRPAGPWPSPLPPPTVAPDVDIPATYRAAVVVLDRDGWCQGTEESHDGRHCVAGALRIAAGMPAAGAIYDDMTRENLLLRPLQNHVRGLVTVWNDARSRTADEVRAALLAVADENERTTR